MGSVLGNLGTNDDLVVVTDRGMYADHRGDHLIDDLLLKLELAVPRGKLPAQTRSQSWRSRLFSSRPAVQAIRFVGKRLLPPAVREALLPFHRAAIGALPPLDWRQTRVFRLPTVGNSYLRVNLSGREPQGIVSPAQYETLLAQIAAHFRALINPATGEPAVEGVYFPAKQFIGPKSSELPDVAILWNSNARIDAVTSNDIGTISGRQGGDRTGNHRPDGFALFRGQAFSAGGGMHQGDARQIAPAVLNYFGVTPPAHYEMLAPEALGRSSRMRAA
jgi:hypothetical protein